MTSRREGGGAIAVVGLACRFPGASTPEDFWKNMREGVTSISSTPEERWYFHAGHGSDERTARRAGYLQDVDRFDARFFGITPREAEWMDPQQRILLELSWACLEDAGHAPATLSGADVGVYVGVSSADYRELLHQSDRHAQSHSPLGIAPSLLANRISSHFNWKGPSIPIDTACSSSLVAVHQAVRDIRAGDCDFALTGGVNLCLTPFVFNCFMRAGMLSPDGLCKTFDAKADGYVRGEGAAFVLLRPLERALADGDSIYGVIRGSAVNHGGAATTITAPNSFSQAAVIEKAFRDAGIGPHQVSFVETHGTGTPLGDPIECTALKRAFSNMAREAGVELREKSITLGAVKAQIGHLEAAAGIAGLAKVLLALEHEELPALAHFQTLNPRIRLEESPFDIPLRRTPWPKGERVAGLSSFGFSGVNAHVVISEPPVRARLPLGDSTRPEAVAARRVFVLSAANEDRLRARARDLITFLSREPGSFRGPSPFEPEGFASMLYTLQVGREALTERLAAVVGDAGELLSLLRAVVDGGPLPQVKRGQVYRPMKAAAAEGTSALDAEALCARWIQGQAVDWESCYGETKPPRMRLPTYPFDDQRYWLTERPAPPRFRNPTVNLPDRSASLQSLLASHRKQERATNAVCAFGVHQALAALGLSGAQARSGLRERLGVAGKHERLLAEMLRIAASAGQLVEEGDSLRLVEKPVAPPPLDASPPSRLLRACLDSLVPVLRGELRATEVLFPGGSMDLVESVYSGNAIADFFNTRAADAVEAAVLERLGGLGEGEKLRLLEVGAGTGGTSKCLFERLRPYADRIAYTYTDKSRSFLHYAERYRPEAPYLTMAVLDIERPLDAATPIQAGSYDVVIAANVLHATRDIRRTVENVGALLKQGGVLVLGEVAAVTPFTTLTFGLLEGWWLFEDVEVRMPGSPALSFEQWARVLTEKGFAEVRTVAGPNAEQLGQQIVTAVQARATAAPRPETPGQALAAAAIAPPAEHAPGETPEASLIATLASVLKIDAGSISTDARLNELGVDSLVGMEMRSMLEQKLQCTIPLSLYLDDLSVREAAQRLAQLQSAPPTPEAPVQDESEEGYV